MVEINQKIQNLIEISNYLNEKKETLLLQNFKECLEDNHFVLPFIGQFSAGKSKLINYILGEEILPTATNETTAYLTYISYGERQAVIHYSDNTTEEIPVEVVHDIDQTAAKQQIKDISRIDVTLPLDLLKGGLVIADTPGVNTVLNQHVEITEHLLESAQYIVYVLGKSPSVEDINMIQQIERVGIQIVFVRTKLDLVKSSEEKIDEVVEKDRDILSRFLQRDIDFFPVCSDEESRKNDIWQYCFQGFLNFLHNNIAKDIKTLALCTVTRRLQPIKESFIKELKERNEIFKQSATISAKDIESQITDLTLKMEIIRQEIEKKRKAITTKTKAVVDNLLQDINRKERIVNRDFSEKLQNLFPVNPDTVKETYLKELQTALQAINTPIDDEINRWKKQCATETVSDLEEMRRVLDMDTSAFSSDFSITNIDTFAEERENAQARFDQTMNQLKQMATMHDDELANLNIKREQIDQSIASLEKAYQTSITDYNKESNEYTPQYIQRGGQFGGTLSKIGDAIDMAMLLIPPSGWAKAGTMLRAKAAKLAVKGGAFANKGAKALTAMSKAAKYMSTFDESKDKALIVKKIEESRLIHNNSQVSPFDYLSVSYWMKQLGDSLDPVRWEIDPEVQQQHHERLGLLQMKAQNTAMQKLTEMQRAGQIQNETERIKTKQLLIKQQMDVAKREHEKELKALKEKEQLEIKNRLIGQATLRYSRVIEEYISKIKPRLKKTFEILTEDVVEAKNEFAIKQLRDRQEALQQVLKAKEGQEKSDEEIIANHNRMIALLENGNA